MRSQVVLQCRALDYHILSSVSTPASVNERVQSTRNCRVLIKAANPRAEGVHVRVTVQAKRAQFVFHHHVRESCEMECTQLRRNLFHSGKTKHYGYRPSKQALHLFCDFRVPTGIIESF